MTYSLLLEIIMFSFVYYVQNFDLRLIFLSIINVIYVDLLNDFISKITFLFDKIFKKTFFLISKFL